MGKPERIVEDYLRKQCKKHDLLIYKFVSPGIAGVPDDIVISDGKVIFIECKSAVGRTSPQQDRRIAEMRQHGAIVYVAKSREQIDEILKKEFDI